MQELHQHQIYELLATKYTRIDLDYVILSAKAATLKGIEALAFHNHLLIGAPF